MAAKGRKTTRKSIEAMFPAKSSQDLVAIEVLVKLAEDKIKMERQSVYEFDDIFPCSLFGIKSETAAQRIMISNSERSEVSISFLISLCVENRLIGINVGMGCEVVPSHNEI